MGLSRSRVSAKAVSSMRNANFPRGEGSCSWGVAEAVGNDEVIGSLSGSAGSKDAKEKSCPSIQASNGWVGDSDEDEDALVGVALVERFRRENERNMGIWTWPV